MTTPKAGPKAAANLTPLPTSGLPKSGGRRVIAWIERFAIVPSGFGARKPMRLQPFQKAIIRKLFDDEAVRSGLVSMPRGNGKTSLCAALALFALFDQVADPQVLAVASDERQAQILTNYVRRMIELSPQLFERVHIYKDRIVNPSNGGVLMALPSQESALQGWAPSTLILDELHVVDHSIWESCLLATGKRERSLCLAISTPAATRDSVMWALTEQGRAGGDPSFAFVEYGAPDGCEIDDPKAWRTANPALGSFLAPDALSAALGKVRDSQFRRLRLGQWVQPDDGWVSHEAWMRLATDRFVEAGTRIACAFDGSVSNDASVLIGCTVEDVPHVFVLGLWARDKADPNWQVPRAEVDRTVAGVFDAFDVAEFAADPYFWQAELLRWSNRWPGRVSEYNTGSHQRMARATDKAFAAISEGRLTNDGDKVLAAHISNCVIKHTPAGDVITKASPNSEHKIDAAVAAVIALDRATHYNNKLEPEPSLGGLIFI